MQSLMNDSSRFCHYCGFENPQEYRLCGNCNQENPVKISTVIQPPQESFPSLIVEIPKSRVIYIILGLLFGCLGIHNFYANRNHVGAAQLILLLLFSWMIIVPFIVVVWMWSIVEICTVKTDGNGIPMN